MVNQMQFLTRFYPLTFLIFLMGGCIPPSELIEVNKHIPKRLLEICPAPNDLTSTVRQVVVKLKKTEQQLDCANGKIEAIGTIISSVKPN